MASRQSVSASSYQWSTAASARPAAAAIAAIAGRSGPGSDQSRKAARINRFVATGPSSFMALEVQRHAGEHVAAERIVGAGEGIAVAVDARAGVDIRLRAVRTDD